MDKGKSEVILTTKDIRTIKSAAFSHVNDVLPRNLDHNDLQTLLICKGFIDFLGYNNIEIAVAFRFEWEKNIK